MVNYSKDMASKGPAPAIHLPSKSVIDEFIHAFPLEFDELFQDESQALERLRDCIIHGTYTEADEELASLLSSMKGSPESEQVRILQWSASFNFLKGDVSACKQHLERILKLEAGEPTALIKMALVELEQNNFDEAIRCLEKSEQRATMNPTFFYYRGELLALANNVELAVKEFNTALTLRPDMFGAMIRKIRCLLAANKLDETRDFLNEMLAVYPTNIDLRHAEAEFNFISGAQEQGSAQLKVLEREHPGFAQVFFTKALILIKSGDLEDAKHYLEKTLSIDPDHQEARLQLAGLFATQKMLPETEAQYELALRAARTAHQLSSIYSVQIATLSQLQVCLRYPELEAKLKYTHFPVYRLIPST